MTVQNAIKKLARYGTVQHSGHDRKYWAEINGHCVSFLPNGEDAPASDIVCTHTCRMGEEPDYQSDYFPGSFFPTLTAAIKYAQKQTA